MENNNMNQKSNSSRLKHFSLAVDLPLALWAALTGKFYLSTPINSINNQQKLNSLTKEELKNSIKEEIKTDPDLFLKTAAYLSPAGGVAYIIQKDMPNILMPWWNKAPSINLQHSGRTLDR